ncbi:MAG: hypothetical protein Q6L19_09020, partial [Gloeomargarita sp. GMQP_bins_69]
RLGSRVNLVMACTVGWWSDDLAAAAVVFAPPLKTRCVFRDLRKLWAAGDQVVPLPAKQTPAIAD